MGIDILTLAAARAGKGGGSASKYKQPDWGAEGEKIVLPEVTYEVDPDTGMVAIMQEFTLVEGAEYIVNYNGVEYKCICSAFNEGDEEEPHINYLIGNVGAVTGGNPTTDPFVIMRASDAEVAELGFYGALLPFDGSASVTVSVRSDIVHKIPAEYVENYSEPLIVMRDINELINGFTHEIVVEAIKQGRTVFLKAISSEGFDGCVGIDVYGRPVFIGVSESQLYTLVVNEDGHITSKIYDANDI